MAQRRLHDNLLKRTYQGVVYIPGKTAQQNGAIRKPLLLRIGVGLGIEKVSSNCLDSY